MEIVRCSKGHFYDAEMYGSCPQCQTDNGSAGSSGATGSAGADPVFDPIRPTEAVGYGSGGEGQNRDALPPTEPVPDPGFTPTDFTPGANYTNVRMESYEPTTPVSPNGTVGFNPVTGWLVCVDGPDKGRDYRIRNGYNYIGRAQSMDICIQGDNHISNQNAAVIGYDDVERLFSFGPAGGHNTVRVNGKMVINAVQLNAYDELTIGTTRLMFIPLCGERFDWNGKNG